MLTLQKSKNNLFCGFPNDSLRPPVADFNNISDESGQNFYKKWLPGKFPKSPLLTENTFPYLVLHKRKKNLRDPNSPQQEDGTIFWTTISKKGITLFYSRTRVAIEWDKLLTATAFPFIQR